MHESRLHYFDPRDEYFTFVNTVYENKEGFTVRKIKGAKDARDLSAVLIYPSSKEYKWAIKSNHIKTSQ